MKISDTVVGAGFVVAGALTVAGTLNYPTLEGGHPGPALFPRILGTLTAALGAGLAVQGARARDATQAVEWRRLHRNTGLVNALFVLGGVLAYLGPSRPRWSASPGRRPPRPTPTTPTS